MKWKKKKLKSNWIRREEKSCGNKKQNKYREENGGKFGNKIRKTVKKNILS